MRILFCLLGLLLAGQPHASPRIVKASPQFASIYRIDGKALCKTARETLAYLNRGAEYDAQVIHEGKTFKIPLERVKKTLVYVCKHQDELNNPDFIRKHFDFYRWYPDLKSAQKTGGRNRLAANLPADQILMTRYYVHRAKVKQAPSPSTPFALYGLAADEASLSLEQAKKKPGLVRFRYGKQAILQGALSHEQVPALAWLAREDLEAALLQGTLVAETNDARKPVTIYNVHRCNDKPWDKTKTPYQQERYWYFKVVEGIKGYGKDANNKITVDPGVTFAADLARFGLGKLLLVQYPAGHQVTMTRIGIMADTGGAFDNNGYQVDFLTGTYPGQAAFYQANRNLPDYVNAYFMVLKQ